jgi:hypothetical protein
MSPVTASTDHVAAVFTEAGGVQGSVRFALIVSLSSCRSLIRR